MDAHGVVPRETVPASRKLGKSDAAKLARAAKKVIVGKGSSLKTFTAGGKAPAEMVQAMLGPTGNLRAPCIRVGQTVVVGFNQEAYESVLL